jgi:hypothetical protein
MCYYLHYKHVSGGGDKILSIYNSQSRYFATQVGRIKVVTLSRVEKEIYSFRHFELNPAGFVALYARSSIRRHSQNEVVQCSTQ